MFKEALGLIETIGLAAAVEAADAAVKSANVELIGYELTKGDGMVTVKVKGNVSSTEVAIESAKRAVLKMGQVYSCKIIPKTVENLEMLIFTPDTVGYEYEEETEPVKEESVELEEEKEESTDHGKEDSTHEDGENMQTNDILEEVYEERDESEENENLELCNLCWDPECPRKKGDLRNKCIHYGERNKGRNRK